MTGSVVSDPQDPGFNPLSNVLKKGFANMFTKQAVPGAAPQSTTPAPQEGSASKSSLSLVLMAAREKKA
jgi:hypothetical protein